MNEDFTTNIQIPWDHQGDQTVQSNQLRGYQDLELLHQYKARYPTLLDRIERKSLYVFAVFVCPKTTEESNSVECKLQETTLREFLSKHPQWRIRYL